MSSHQIESDRSLFANPERRFRHSEYISDSKIGLIGTSSLHELNEVSGGVLMFLGVRLTNYDQS